MGYDLLIILLCAVLFFSIFTLGQFLLRWIVMPLFYCIASPYYLCRWLYRRKLAKLRQQNYEILGNYVVLFGNNPEILQSFRSLIEQGIKPKEFQKLLENNLQNMKKFEIGLQKDAALAQFEQEHDLKKIAAEQQEMLAQSRLSIEQIKFREKLLDDLYQKIKKKYRL